MDFPSQGRRRVSAALVIAVLFVASCANEEGGPQGSVRLEAHDFDTLVEMQEASDAVIEGTVIEVEPGELITLDDDAIYPSLLITIRVDSVLDGTVEGETIILDEADVEEDRPQEDLPPNSQVGDHGVYFLDYVDPYYYLINSEGRFLVEDGGLVASNDTDAWAQAIELLNLEELKQLIE
jgi:hypothetical protein